MGKKIICSWESTCDDDCRRPYGNCPDNCQNYKPFVSIADLEKENEQLKCDLYNTSANLERITVECENLEKENAELKKEISVLLSCANCPENKGGYICEKEYNDKCLAQKIEYIKELKEQIETMKCCGNCSEPCWDPPIVRKFECLDNNYSLWRLRK